MEKNKKRKEPRRKQVGRQDKLKEQLVRALADYDNLKKRSEKEREIYNEQAKMRVLGNLLPIFDMFEQVQAHVDDSGLAMAMGELGNALREEGLVVVEPGAGDEFDEETMEAIEAISDTEIESGKVVELGLKGWKMGDKVLRYAKVVVCKK